MARKKSCLNFVLYNPKIQQEIRQKSKKKFRKIVAERKHIKRKKTQVHFLHPFLLTNISGAK